MLKLYHTPMSPNSRRVWIALLEKDLQFELVELQLDGDQLQSEFLEISPFHHIPVLVDDDLSVVESLAILDFLEAKYPTPTMMPKDARAIAIVRMVEMVTVNELMPATNPLVREMIGLAGDSQKQEQAKQQSATVLTLFERLLGNNSYFGGEQLSLADIVAGTIIPWFPTLGVPLEEYSKLNAWCDRLMNRPTWQATQPSLEEVKSRMKIVMASQQTHS